MTWKIPALVAVAALLAVLFGQVAHGAWQLKRDHAAALSTIKQQGTAETSAFVDAWSETHTSPTRADVSRLRFLAERFRESPTEARPLADELLEQRDASRHARAAAERDPDRARAEVEAFVSWVLLATGLGLFVLAAVAVIREQ